jgi:hypothetical protein
MHYLLHFQQASGANLHLSALLHYELARKDIPTVVIVVNYVSSTVTIDVFNAARTSFNGPFAFIE